MNLRLRFSIIIPTYHRNDLLASCLDCLAPGVQTLPPEQYEVIVTDDGFQSTAEEIIRERYPWVNWVAGPRRGPAANRNNGAKHARGEWLAFTDDDCLPDPQWLEAYAAATVAQIDYLVFEGQTYVDRPRCSLAETSPINQSGGYLWSCNFMMQRNQFESLAGFDERFPYAAMEDVDLGLRLTKRGHQCFFVQAASVCHPWRAKGGWEKIKQHQESTFIYLALHPEELSRLTSTYYIRLTLRYLLQEIIPGLIQFKAAGIKVALMELMATLQMAYFMRVRSHATNS
ncbi:MAG TPA: glycosyltransferase [Candidatus Caenarcaniphilales bacterium]